MPLRPCIICGTPCPLGRCDAHRRPSAHKRGYDEAHRRARARLAQELPGPCGYGCGAMLYQGGLDSQGGPTDNPPHPCADPVTLWVSDWVAAHVIDGDPTAGWLASCRSCNERAKRRR